MIIQVSEMGDMYGKQFVLRLHTLRYFGRKWLESITETLHNKMVSGLTVWCHLQETE